MFPWDRWYSILGVSVLFAADTEVAFQQVDEDFAGFAVPAPVSAVGMRMEVRLTGVRPGITLDGAFSSLEGNPYPEFCIIQTFLKGLFRAIRTHYVLHAAVVAKGDRLLVIAGEPGSGKTTLTEKLLQRGWVLFSDDYCPLDTSSGLVSPFPRALRRAMGPAAVAELTGERPRAAELHKESVLPGAAGYPVGSAPLPVGAFVWLDGADPKGHPGTAGDRQETMRVRFKGPHRTVPAEWEGLARNGELRVDMLSELDWRIHYHSRPGPVSVLRSWVRSHQDDLWNVYREAPPVPDFSGFPVLKPLAPVEAVRLLVRDAKHAALDGFNGQQFQADITTPGAMFFQLLHHFSRTPCYQLQVGQLGPSVDALAALLM